MQLPPLPNAEGVQRSSETQRTQAHSRVAKFVVPEIVFGEGTLAEVGHAARRVGGCHVLVVTDPQVVEAGWADRAVSSLREAGLGCSVWHDLTPNPKDHEVAAGFQRYAEQGCDVLVAVGGGSCIDAAKGIAVLSTNSGRILDYEGIDRVAKPIPPVVAAPTTSGSGADVSQFAIITDTTRRIKATLIGRALVPDISITDPRLTTTLPNLFRAATGMDALTHGIEAFVSRAASFLTDSHALNAIRLIGEHLPRTIEDPGDRLARASVARASLEAGLAFTNAILGATHAMSHQLGGALDLPHGMLDAILLPHVMRCNAEAVPERYVPIAEALSLDVGRLGAGKAAEAAAAAVEELTRTVGLPARLADLGVRPSDLELLAEHALHDACMTTNPRLMTASGVAALFKEAL
jgi:alcohol dehydrogenase